jgi:galactokinase
MRGDVAALGAAMDENHVLLRRMGVSTEELEALVELGRRGGALGAKLTGGGGGGAILCLCGSEPQELVQLYRRRGWEAFSTVVPSTAVPARRRTSGLAVGVRRPQAEVDGERAPAPSAPLNFARARP